MKKRKLAIITFLLCACLVIGVGYATIEQALTANISANVGTAELDVYFTAATADINATDAKLDTATKANSVTLVPTTLKEKDDFSQGTFTITNQETINQFDAKIAYVTTVNQRSELFDVTYQFVATGDDADSGVVIAGDAQSVTTLPYGQSVNVIVTVTLKKGVTDPVAATLGIQFRASSID